MSRNKSFLISEVGKIVRLLLLSQATNIETDGVISALKRVKTYLRSTMGNNLLHALMLVHVQLILRINLLIEKTAASKHSNIFLRIIHNICKIKFSLR